MSSEAAPPVATPPGEPDAELLAALLAELDGSSDNRLAAFARSYARRVRIDQVERPAPAELAAQVRSLFTFVDSRRGDVAVRALNPTRERDGYVTHGTVVEANTQDAPVPDRQRQRGAAQPRPARCGWWCIR